MSKTIINAQVVADSLNPQGDRLISVLATFPRFILAEVNTHRMLTKNTASSRAIPFLKMVETIKNNPFIPIAWQKDHKGMQGTEYFTKSYEIEDCERNWLVARDKAIQVAIRLSDNKVTKQLCNRLLEPFMWTTMLITGSKEGWDNFFELRCPNYCMEENEFYKSWKEVLKCYDFEKETIEDGYLFKAAHNTGQAEIHMMDLAEKIYDAFNESTPKQLQAGEWHIPFYDTADKFGPGPWIDYCNNNSNADYHSLEEFTQFRVKISTAMAARTSYTVVGEEKELNYENLIALHDRLIVQNPLHASPMEHCARAMNNEEYVSHVKGTPDLQEFINEDGFGIAYHKVYQDNPEAGWCRNYKGFIQYRHILETK